MEWIIKTMKIYSHLADEIFYNIFLGLLAMSGKLSRWEQSLLSKVFEDNSPPLLSSTIDLSHVNSSYDNMLPGNQQAQKSPTDPLVFTPAESTGLLSQQYVHNFIKMPLSKSAHSKQVVGLLASYR